MSDEDSPTGAHSALDEDPNSSIIKKVRSRVSSIFPDSLSKWFSPSSATKNNKNGSLRRRRDSTSDEEGSSNDPVVEPNAPSNKRTKIDEHFNSSLTDLDDLMNAPGPSGLNTSAAAGVRRTASATETLTIQTTKFSSSTPTTSPSLLSQHHKNLIGLNNKASGPYEFTNRNASTSLENDKDSSPSITNIKQRRSIRENISFDASSRKRLNIPQMSNDRSTSEPPFSLFTRKPSTSESLSQKFSSTVRPDSSEDLIEEEEGDNKNDTIPVDANDSNLLSNGNANETASDTSSVGGYPSTCLQYTQSEQNRRFTGFMGNNRIKRFRGGSTGDLCFTTHLETEKSLFSEKNNSRPSFNASLYGSSSSLSSSNSRLFANSPFYKGRTMYGGASAYASKQDYRLHKALRIPVQIRPSSSLSTLSSSNNSIASDAGTLSNTAKRILDIMNQFSSPLNDARKMGNSLNNVMKIPGLVHNRKRFDEDDMKMNRSIHMSSPRTPYSRPSSNNNNATINKPITNELQIPSMSQLLHMKRLQNNTENIRKLASESTSVLNDSIEYKLPNQQDDTNNNVKHSNKMKNKLNRVRPHNNANNNQNDDNLTVPQVKLPDVQLPLLKAVPKFDIKLPTTSVATPAATPTNTIKPITPSNVVTTTAVTTATTIQQPPSNKFKFSTPINLSLNPSLANTKQEHNLLNFKFSEPEPLGSTKVDSDKISKVNNNKSALIKNNNSKLGEFKFNPETAKPKLNNASVAAASPYESSTKSSSSALKSSGSCVDILNKVCGATKTTSSEMKTLKSGSCLDVFKTSTTPPTSTTATTLTTSGFGNQFKLTTNKWECSTCMIRNDAEKTKCVACETPKAGAAPAAPIASTPIIPKVTDEGFKSLIAKQSAKWECSDCTARNDADKLKCACCEKAKPGTSAALPMTPSPVPIIHKSTDSDFKNLVAQQIENKWKCSACMTRNEASRSKCACCEQAKPGATPDNAAQFSFGSKTAATSKFSFGVPPQTDTNVTIKEVSTPSFSFGVPASSAITATETKATNFVFGVSPKPPAAEAKTIIFGAKTPEVAAPKPAGGFSFGVKPATTDATDSKVPETKEKKEEEPKKPIVFGAAAPGGFSFGVKSATIVAQKPETITSTNATVAEKPMAGRFSFGISTPAKVEEKKDASSESVGFSFAQTTKKEEVKPAVPIFGAPIASSNTEAKPSPATFSFGGPTTKVGRDTEDKTSGARFSFSSPNPGIGGLGTKKENEEPAKKPNAPIFGAFSAPKTDAPSITPTFSFGAVNPTTTNNVARPTFGLGATTTKTISSETTTTSTPFFGFGGTNTNTQQKSVENKAMPSFGSVSNTEKSTPTFGGFGNTNTVSSAAPAPVFGNTTTSSSFTFGSPAAGSKPESTPAPYSFGASNTNTNNPPSFGSSQTTTAPGFGLPSFGSFANNTNTSTQLFGAPTQAPSPFGAATTTPAFGGASVPTLGSTNTTSIFGAASSTFGSNNTAPPAFGAPSFGSSTPFGGNNAQHTSDEPLSKKPSTAFEFGSGAGNNNQAAAPYAFGAANNNDNTVKPFSFSANSAPSFNFTSGSNNNAGPQTTPNPSAFQFGAAPTNNNINPFAAQNTGQSSQAPRRKIRAARRVTPR